MEVKVSATVLMVRPIFRGNLTYWKEPFKFGYICLYEDNADEGPVNFSKSEG